MDKSLEEVFHEHKEILRQKKFLNKTYLSWYKEFINSVSPIENKKILELGSGGGLLKELYPSIITSDVIELPQCDIICKGEDIPFEDESLDALFLLNTLHHIPDSEQFFKEADRVLKNNGIIYITEPANTAFSRFVYKNFHHEPFDTKQVGWSIDSSNPLFDSNQALCWIIFHRDRELFQKSYPNLLIERRFLHTPFRYLLSGGYSANAFLPSWSYGLVYGLEKAFYPLNRFFALFETVIIRKKNNHEK